MTLEIAIKNIEALINNKTSFSNMQEAVIASQSLEVLKKLLEPKPEDKKE